MWFFIEIKNTFRTDVGNLFSSMKAKKKVFFFFFKAPEKSQNIFFKNIFIHVSFIILVLTFASTT